MSLGLLMDVHVRREVTDSLRSREVDVVTAQEDSADELPDSELLDRARKLDRLLFTQDEDLLAEGVRRQRTGEHFGGIVYAQQIKVTIRQCVDDLELICKVCDADEMANRIEYLPLKPAKPRHQG